MVKTLDHWDPKFTGAHAAHAVLKAAHAPFERTAEWPTLEAWNAVGPATPMFATEQKRARRARGPRSLDSLYDARIVEAGQVPSREQSWHDYLNMLVWRTLPRAKLALHTEQYEALKADLGGAVVDKLPNARSRRRDRLTMFDEGGVVRVTHGGRTRFVLFGHAHHEHLVRGYLGPLHASECTLQEVNSLDDLDTRLAAWISTEFFTGETDSRKALDIHEIPRDAWWSAAS